MTDMHNSENYIWGTDSKSELGSGATGTVYLGLTKLTGIKVAVKVIKSDLKPLFNEYIQKEVEFLTEMRHDNIVKLLCDEIPKSGPGSRALVLELCEGGSLQRLLQPPKHRFGLGDQTVLDIVRDVVNGLRYLKQVRIIHRDLKPANILIAHSEFGKCIYKVTDFGGAHQTKDKHAPEVFNTVFGTMELMHPDMLEKGAINKDKVVVFDVSVDLWSAGVLIYQACCGRLPFKPYRGRADRDTLYRLSGRKNRGEISGSDNENGLVSMQRSLPETCPLSPALQQDMTSLIAGLLERDKQYQCSRDSFFEEADKITSKISVNIFFTVTGTHLILYVKKTASIRDFQKCIEESLKINIDNQFLLIGSNSVEEVMALDSTGDRTVENMVKTYKITKENPVALLVRSPVDNVRHQPVFGKESDIPSTQQADNEAPGIDVWKWSRNCTSVAHLYLRLFDNIHQTLRLGATVQINLGHFIANKLAQLNDQHKQVEIFMHILRKNTKRAMVKASHEMVTEKAADSIKTDLDTESVMEIQSINHAQHSLKKALKKIHEVQATHSELSARNEDMLVNVEKLEHNLDKVRHLTSSMDKTTEFLRDQKNARLSHNMRQRRLIEVTNQFKVIDEISGMYIKAADRVTMVYTHLLVKYFSKSMRLCSVCELIRGQMDGGLDGVRKSLGVSIPGSIPGKEDSASSVVLPSPRMETTVIRGHPEGSETTTALSIDRQRVKIADKKYA